MYEWVKDLYLEAIEDTQRSEKGFKRSMRKMLDKYPIGRYNDIFDSIKTVWIWSDLHIGHENILTKFVYRPFKDLEDMNESIFRATDFLTKEDTLLFVGDCWMRKGRKDFEEYLKTLPCRKILVVGNHDLTGAGNLRVDGFDEVYSAIVDDPTFILISHLPLTVSGWWTNIHGHTHEDPNNDDKHVSVCLEHLEYKPVPLYEVYNLCAEVLLGNVETPFITIDEINKERIKSIKTIGKVSTKIL